MAGDAGLAAIIQRRALHGGVGQREAAGLDHVQGDPEAGGEANGRAKILGDVRLIESEPHVRASSAGESGGIWEPISTTCGDAPRALTSPD